MLCTGLFSLQVFCSDWNPMGKGGVCVCVDTPFPSPPLIYLLHVGDCVCYASLAFSSSLWRAFPSKLQVFTKGEKLEQQKGWMVREENGRQSFPPVLPPSPAMCHSPEWLWVLLVQLGPAISIQKMKKIRGRYMVQGEGNCFGGNMKKYLL